MQAGAGAFIGAYWSVYARAAIRAGGDPTWLAYKVFADPLASVEPLSA